MQQTVGNRRSYKESENTRKIIGVLASMIAHYNWSRDVYRKQIRQYAIIIIIVWV